MSLIIFKTLAAISILLLTLISGFLPAKIAKTKTSLLCFSDAFSSGVFLGVALLHMLPEAVNKFHTVSNGNHYPFAQLICIAAFVLLLVMERGISAYNKSTFSDSKVIAPIFLMTLLTIHSLVEGAAIGINNNLAEALILFCAIIAHKGSESFALATELRHNDLTTVNIKKIILFFSLVTPLGILSASLVMHALKTNSGSAFCAIFNAIAAGTFLYLSTEHLIERKKSFESFAEIISLALGITLMALVAFWI